MSAPGCQGLLGYNSFNMQKLLLKHFALSTFVNSIAFMKRCNSSWRLIALFTGALTLSSGAAELVARVKTDRVNLRAKPDTSSEVVAQANAEDRLSVVSSQDEWVEIVPPDSVDVWAHVDFVKDGLSAANKLNLRAGPGINYSVVGSIDRGQVVPVRGQFGEWLKVAPTHATLWVSRPFVDLVSPVAAVGAPVPVVSAPTSATPEPVAPATPLGAAAESQLPMLPPAEPAPPTVALPQSELPPAQPVAPVALDAPSASKTAGAIPLPPDLRPVPLEGQGRYVSREGELKPAPFLFGRPSAFRLVKKEGVQLVTVCYVRGNSAQLNSLLNEQLTVFGYEYWVQGVRQPVIVLERIERRVP